MIKRPHLVGAWLIVAAVLSYAAAIDILKWRADADFVRMGLTWADSYLPHAVVAGVIAVACIGTNRIGLWIAIAASSVFGLYFASYLVFGGEGAFLLRVVSPLVLLALAALTIRYALSRLRSKNEAGPPTKVRGDAR